MYRLLLLSLLFACAGEEAALEPAPAPAVTQPAPAPAPPPAPVIPPLPEDANPALTDASLAAETAPDTYKVKFTTTKGDAVIHVHREWSPNGADRLYNLVKIGFYSDVAFFRNVDNFMVQFGIHGHPQVNAAWRTATIDDDPVIQSNLPGKVTFAKTGAPNSRSTQLFINHKNNANLDGMGFSPLGDVVEGMEVIQSLYKGYGEGPPRGQGPHQGRMQSEGNTYLKADFPKLDYIISAEIVD
jgi:peptidyl-prolyl cis-trans isomerase A (cyclophilin A)